MDITSPEQIQHFLEELGRRWPEPAELYIFGGSALVLIGGARHTGDVDYTLNARDPEKFRQTIAALAVELDLDLEESVPAEFVPLPVGAEGRHQLIGRFGQLTAYIFDPYSIALMKIDRAFQTDMQDVQFLIRAGHVDLALLEQYVEDVAQRYDEPLRLRQNFAELKRGLLRQ